MKIKYLFIHFFFRDFVIGLNVFKRSTAKKLSGVVLIFHKFRKQFRKKHCNLMMEGITSIGVGGRGTSITHVEMKYLSRGQQLNPHWT